MQIAIPDSSSAFCRAFNRCYWTWIWDSIGGHTSSFVICVSSTVQDVCQFSVIDLANPWALSAPWEPTLRLCAMQNVATVALGQDRRHSIPCQFQGSWWCQCMPPSTIPTINLLLCTYTCAYWFQMIYIHVSIDFRWLWWCLLMQYPILTIISLWSRTVYTTTIMIMYFYYHDYRLEFTVLSLSSCLDYSYHHAIVFMLGTLILYISLLSYYHLWLLS